MNKDKTEQINSAKLREEFAKSFGIDIYIDEPRKMQIKSYKGEQICDWWIQKLGALLEEQRLEVHETNNGWCCACDYDQIELNRRLEEQKQEIAEEVEKLRKVYDADTTEREMIDPACVDGFNVALDTVLSIIKK